MLLDENNAVLDYKNEYLPSFDKHAIIDVTINTFMPAPVRGARSLTGIIRISALTHSMICWHAVSGWA